MLHDDILGKELTAYSTFFTLFLFFFFSARQCHDSAKCLGPGLGCSPEAELLPRSTGEDQKPRSIDIFDVGVCRDRQKYAAFHVCGFALVHHHLSSFIRRWTLGLVVVVLQHVCLVLLGGPLGPATALAAPPPVR